MMLEPEIIHNCAPTLAGIKTGNLFSYKYCDETALCTEIAELNRSVNEKGVFVERLKAKDGHALIYVYRKSSLSRDLTRSEIRGILDRYGYPADSVPGAIRRLKERLAKEECFPHEIGVFLGYPPEDVKGFIENEGRDCKCCGIWKVYCNEKEARKLFEKLNKCAMVYSRVFAEGRRSMKEMTVSA